MYQVKLGDKLLFDPRLPELSMLSPSCKVAVNEAGSLSFILAPDHKLAGELKVRGKDPVLVLDGAECLLRGQVIAAQRLFDNSIRYEVEGELAALNDAVMPPFYYPDDFGGPTGESDSRNTVEFLLQTVVQHAAQETSRPISVGAVTVRDPNNYIVRASSKPMTCWDIIKKKVLDTLGGYLVTEYTATGTIINYYDTLPETSEQLIQYGENLLDLDDETDASDQCTAVYPVGKDGLDLSKLPDTVLSPGYKKIGNLIHATDLEGASGINPCVRMVEWPNVTDPNRLKTKALAWLKREGIKQRRTLRITAADLGKPHFQPGQMVRVSSRPHGYDLRLPIIAVAPDLEDPTQTKLTLDRKTTTNTSQQAQSEADMEEQLSRSELTVNVPIKALSGTGYTCELTRVKNGVQLSGYGQVTLQAGIRVTTTQTIKKGTDIHIAQVSTGFRPGLNAAAYVGNQSTNERQYTSIVEKTGDIVIRPSIDMPAASYYLYVASTYYTKE